MGHMRQKLKQVESQLYNLENNLLKLEIEKVFMIKHFVYFSLTIFILFNCAGSPIEPIPKPVPEVVLSTVAVSLKPPKSIMINSIEYDRSSMTIQWGASKDYDFEKYILLTMQNESKIVFLFLLGDGFKACQYLVPPATKS